MILLDVHYRPVPWKAPRLGKYTTYDPVYKEKQDIRILLRQTYQGDLIFDPVHIEIKFFFTPPKHISKKKLPSYYKNVLPCLTAPDCTNLQKLFEDCLQGIVIKKDHQVVKITSEKLWDTEDHIYCKITKISQEG